MAKQSLTTIKNWFKSTFKPTQTQFWDTWDSFFHKDEKIPSASVEGLDETLTSKASTELVNYLRAEVENFAGDMAAKLDRGGYTGSAQDLSNAIQNVLAVLASDDTTLDELQEIVTYIKQNKQVLESLGISNIAGLQDALNGKVDKVAGKQLTTEDFTTLLKLKLDAIDMTSKLDRGGYTGTAKDLSNAIQNILAVLASDDTTLDELQEIVNYIKQNKQVLETLGISNIAGLQDALDNTVKLSGEQTISDIKTFEKFPEIIVPSYMVGDPGPSGGIIIYDKGNDSDGWRYLEAAPNDLIAATWWNGAYIATGATQMAIGSGLDNTKTIVSAQGNTGNYAAKICRDFVFGGYSDWFLSSFNEAELLALIGLEGNYWTSTETGDNGARMIILPSKGWGGADKSTTANVRPIRRFSSHPAPPTKPEQFASKAYVDGKAEGKRIELTGTEIDFSAGDIFVKTLTDDTTLTVVNPVVGKEILLIVDGNHALNLPGTKMGAMSYNGLASNYISLKCVEATIPSFIFSVDRKEADIQYDTIDIHLTNPISTNTVIISTFEANDIWIRSGRFKTKTNAGIINIFDPSMESLSNKVNTDKGGIAYFSTGYNMNLGTEYSWDELIINAPGLISLDLASVTGLLKFNNSTSCFDLSIFPKLEIFYLDFNPAIPEIIFPAGCLKKIYVYNEISNTIVFPESMDSSFVDVELNLPLTSASVNSILSRARLWIIPTGKKSIRLYGNNCAAPTGQGLTDKAALIASGWTVYTK